MKPAGCLHRPSRLQLTAMLWAAIPVTLLTFFVIDPEHGHGLVAAAAWLFLLALAIRAGFISIISRQFTRTANRPWLAIVIVGCVALAVSMLLSLIIPPMPFVMDEFAYLHGADTFASGRLTNPTHPLWESFEFLSILPQPTTSSKYPPAQSFFMAAGQVATGRPIVGVWLSFALACASLCWMLQAWLPPRWAFLGGLVAATHPGMQAGLFMETGMIKDAIMGTINPNMAWYYFRCSWSQSYWGGAVAMLGGCLVYGALPRIVQKCNPRPSAAMALGLIIMANSRPFEGLVTSLPAGLVMLKWLYGRTRSGALKSAVTGFLIPFAIVIIPGFYLMGLYNHAVTGNPLKMPYQIYSHEFDSAPMFVFMKPKPPIEYRNEFIRIVYSWHTQHFMRQQTLLGWLNDRKNYLFSPQLYFFGPLAFSVVWLPAAVRRKPVAFAAMAFYSLFAVHQFVVATMPHYLAPATGLFMVVIMGCARELSVMKYRSKPVGRYMFLAMLALVPLATVTSKLKQSTLPRPIIFDREAIVADLEKRDGKHLVMVRDGTFKNGVLLDWVINPADIDKSKTVWAREMGREQNRKVLDYYRDRTVWLLETETRPLELKPYKLE